MNNLTLKYILVLAVSTSFLFYAFEQSKTLDSKFVTSNSISVLPNANNNTIKTNITEDKKIVYSNKNKILDNRKLLVD
jgi:hypothetical protein